MDERMLKELELLDVARLCGLQLREAPVPSRNTEATGTAEVSRRPADGPTTDMAKAQAPAQAKTRAQTPKVVLERPAVDSSIATMDWEALRASVAACRACALCEERKQAVFGVGAPEASWMFVGEGPGADEDEQGEPFVGQAGKLLDQMLSAAGLERGREVYIANVVKCRPPGNRTPTAAEAAACAPYLDRQVALVKPRLLVALGKTAAQRLLGEDPVPTLGAARGKVHDYRGIPVVVTYHPAYLLRSLPEKAKAWEDLVFARKALAAAAP